MSTATFETLESRTLLTGVTVMATGRNGTLGGWMETMSQAYTTRMGGPSQVPRYILHVVSNSTGDVVTEPIRHVDGTGTPQSATNGEILLEVDYFELSTETAFSAYSIGAAVADFMLNTPVDGVKLAELPIHTLGLSRGSVVMEGIAKRLGESGVWVEQSTYLDPLPIRVMGDPDPTLFDNVEYAEDYWRTAHNTDGTDYDGEPTPGAYNLFMPWIDAHHDGYSLVHLAPSGYYIGTIDFNATQSGEGPIYNDWYGNTDSQPAKDQTGFAYTSYVGKDRPLSGVWAASGGSGTRVASGQDGPQWANLADLSLASSAAITAGQSVSIKYLQQDRDDSSQATFYLDRDKTPYNGDFAYTLGSANFASSSTINSGTTAGTTAGVQAGTYWLAAKITDGQGHVRFVYGKQVTVNAVTPPPTDPNPPPTDPNPPPTDPNPPPTDPNPPPSDPPPTPSGPTIDARLSSDHILRIMGGSADDIIKVSGSPSQANRLVVNINGETAAFVLGSVSKIYIYGQAGNDTLMINEKYGSISVPARISGGDGNDRIYGGLGRDSLFGDLGNDRLYGGGNRDRLDGGLGTDRLYGQGGSDWFVASKHIELMDMGRGDALLS